MTPFFVWLIAALSIAGVLFRPFAWPEAVWACAGAALMVIFGLLPAAQAASAAARGTDVYLFLTGMMLLSELAREKGVFDWLAGVAASAGGGSQIRLFALVYLAGVVVTVFLSNDATAVVLTPAVYAVVKRAKASPMPFLFACAFIANAASFVLPISNPANLVLYGKNLPPLFGWIKLFFVPSVVSIFATYFVLRWVSRKDLAGAVHRPENVQPLTAGGRRATAGILLTAAVLLVASALGRDLGLPTLIAAVAVVLVVASDGLPAIIRGVSWSVLPLVAGLFVLVEAANQAGALRLGHNIVQYLGALPKSTGALAASFGIAAVSNLVNNLPSGLLTSGVLHTGTVPDHIRHALLLGIDLGPNLSVTGSLATVLWLIALRREQQPVSGSQFLKVGALVMPPALLLSTLALLLTTK